VKVQKGGGRRGEHMRKRSWPNRKNRRCPDCTRMITYTRKDAFDRAVDNNTVCKSCAQMDRKLTLETIEKMKQPKTIEHKKRISKSISNWWEIRKQEEIDYGVNRQQTIKS